MIAIIWEHNGNDTLLYARDYPGAFARGADLEEALGKMPGEVAAFCRWAGWDMPEDTTCRVVQEKASELTIKDADSDVIFEAEKKSLTQEEYEALRALAMQSARDFEALYEAVPDKDRTALSSRATFYDRVPVTAREMYEHTRSVNPYYFGEIDVEADAEGGIAECRARGFDALEKEAGFLEKPVYDGSYGELWSLRKVLRRFIWHDRIHAKAMLRMADKTFGKGTVKDPFGLENR